MTTQTEALKLALEALENINNAMPFPVGSQAITAIKEALAQPEQRSVSEHLEPVVWIHNFIEGGVSIGKRPIDLDRHPDRWTALYKDPKPCPTCEALARTVMLDQTYYENQTRGDDE